MRSWLFASFYLIGGRAVMGSIVSRANRLHDAGSRTLILGAGEVGHLVARRLLANPELGLRPVGFIDNDPADVGPRASGVPLLGSDADIDRVIVDHGIEHAVISFSRAGHEAQLQISRALHRLDVSVSVVPRLFEAFPDRLNLDRVAGLPLITVHPSNPRAWPVTVKYALDRCAAAAGIVIASPLLLFGAIGTAISLGRPILFRQRRVGLDGREFDILKFRTMPGTPEDGGEVNAGWAASAGADDGEDSPAPSLAPPDRKPTRFGAMMRRYSLDELPQLFNVLRGQMSLVGPRPELPSYVATFRHSIRRYDDRHQVKAGITGWAQVNGLRGDTSLRDRIEWDNYYIENWSMWLDLKTLLLTATAIFREPK
jgi:exopolysaccharide biosynthesis polyprenyl glycosylphosphotransferase